LDKIWLDIKGFEGLYQISNSGDVRSLDQKASTDKRFSKAGTVSKHSNNNKHPRIIVRLRDNTGHTISKSLHYIVAEHFVPNSHEYTKVKFINGNVYDWKSDNLEWVEK
jgi:hypothetical protein